MVLPELDNKVRKIAGALGIIQASAWTIMSLICIILYLGPLKTDIAKTYMDLVGLNIYYMFLSTDNKIFEDQTFTGNTFTGFMWIYFLLDIFWLIMSIYILRQVTSKVFSIWGYLTLVICFWDFLTFVILGADYDRCLKAAGGFIRSQQLCANTFLPVFIIAAKGFTLWIINIILGVAFVKMGKKLNGNKN